MFPREFTQAQPIHRLGHMAITEWYLLRDRIQWESCSTAHSRIHAPRQALNDLETKLAFSHAYIKKSFKNSFTPTLKIVSELVDNGFQ